MPKHDLNIHFVSNIDGDHVNEILKNLNPSLSKLISNMVTSRKKWF